MQSGRGEKIYKNSIECFSKISKEEGFAAFFKGNMSNILRSVGSSLVLVLYDEFKKLMAQSNKKLWMTFLLHKYSHVHEFLIKFKNIKKFSFYLKMS